jgi:hypothetical protein
VSRFDSLTAASTPWAFSQESPLTTSEFYRAAGQRGIALREHQLRELWRIGALAPFGEIRDRPLNPPTPSSIPEPHSGAWMVNNLRAARDSGRLIDPGQLGYRPQLRFQRSPSTTRWWNGLLYSKWQLIGLFHLRGILGRGQTSLRDHTLRWRCPPLHEAEAAQAQRYRTLAAVLVAIEARYLPIIERSWIHLSGASVEEWEAFAAAFDPLSVLAALNWTPDDLLKAADDLLIGLQHWIDPLQDDWSELIRRAPQRTWDQLSGNALVALDHRIAAEVIVRCYEDIADNQGAPPLADRADTFHAEAERERISYRPRSLDANLSDLGISPHPGVVLVVEGETEEVLVPLVRDNLRIPNQAEFVQSVVLRGVTRDITKLAAFACAPLIERKQSDHWLLVKPPTRLLIVVDPDAPYDSPTNVDAERQKILDEIVAVIRAQGVEPNLEDIDPLLEITTWDESCFEFAHFDDSELARGIATVHATCNGLTHDQLVQALYAHRSNRQDIKKVWTNWRPWVSKRDLAHALWPILEAKLEAARTGDAVPPIAERLIFAFQTAGHRARGQFALRGSSIERE